MMSSDTKSGLLFAALASEALNRSSTENWNRNGTSPKLGLATGTLMVATTKTAAKQAALDLAPGRAYWPDVQGVAGRLPPVQ